MPQRRPWRVPGGPPAPCRPRCPRRLHRRRGRCMKKAVPAFPAGCVDNGRSMPGSAEAETSKTKTCTGFIFDRGGNRPYYTRPMAPGLPDLVDCVRLADEAAVLEREFALADLPRLQDLLAASDGSVAARYAFERVDGSRAGATVSVEAAP